jgi:bacterioferritin
MNRQKTIQLLNRSVAAELQAVHQYMYFHFHLDDQGLQQLAELFKQTAIREMGHAELLAERILFLKGDVEMVAAGPVEKILEPEPMLAKGMAMEAESVEFYNKAALACSAEADSVSKRAFERLVEDEEGHEEQFEKQREKIKRFGLSYLALQSVSAKIHGDDAGSGE